MLSCWDANQNMTPYADKIVAFQDAIGELVLTSEEFHALSRTPSNAYSDKEREEIREKRRQAEIKLLRLYNDLLTKLQINNILP